MATKKALIGPNRVRQINKWFMFPDLLGNAAAKIEARFVGYYTKDDITQIKGGFPVGQNVTFTPSKTPTVRGGCALVGTAVASSHAIKRAWVFERRDGVQIEMKTYDTGVYFLIDGVMSDYELLEGGYTADKDFCYAVISESGDANSRVNWCNGVENWRKWTGLYTLYASDNGANQITIQGSIDLSVLGFPASGIISYKGTQITYTGLSGKTFTGCSAVPAGAVAGDILVDAPVVFTGSGVYPSSVCGVFDGRIHARYEAKQSVSLYSKLDNPDDWTTGSTDGDGGAKEIEQGGPITAYANDEEKVYIFKNRLIKTLQYVANTTRIDVPKYAILKPGNDKSTTIGAIGQKSTFASPNGIIFVTQDKQLIHLKRQQFVDYPQLLNIADAIRPTFEAGVHDEAVGVVHNSKVYYAYKQDSHSSFNDTVIVFDLIRETWSLPYIGWNVSDWTVVDGKLRWHSSTSPDTYELSDAPNDDGNPFTSILRTWQETFGVPQLRKKIGYVMIEVYLKENSEVTADVIYDENGNAGIESFSLDGKETRFKVGPTNYNPFGANPFGEERFGSNPDVSGMTKYRFFLELKGNIEFYNVALQLSTNSENCNYELIRFGYFLNSVIYLPDMTYIIAPENVIDNLNLE